MNFIFLAILFFLFFLSTLIVTFTLYTGISPMPTSKKVRKALLEAFPMVQGPIYELGAGWGGLAFALAKKFPGNQIIAIELSPIPWLYLKLCNHFSSCQNVEIRRRNFFRESLHDAACVVTYLYPRAMDRLKCKFDRELKPGVWMVTHSFALPESDPIETIECKDFYQTKIFFYKKKE